MRCPCPSFTSITSFNFFSSFHISVFHKFESIVYVEFNRLLVNTVSGAANEAATPNACDGYKFKIN
jgi:hypothetical protein